MKLKEIVQKLKETNFTCNVYGKPNEGIILKIDLETNQALVRLKHSVQTTESFSVLNDFANSENEYHFEEREVSLYELWLNIE